MVSNTNQAYDELASPVRSSQLLEDQLVMEEIKRLISLP
jgi:hypothetical protein